MNTMDHGQYLISVPSIGQAADAIPESYESWIANRNVPKIKAVMLSRDTHLQICGGESKISACMGAFEVIFSDVASVGLLQATSVAKLRSLQGNHRLIRVYSVTVHAINLILSRMPNKQLRERAALVREPLGFRIVLIGGTVARYNRRDSEF